MKTFEIKNGMQVICESQNTRNGFRHIAILMNNGNEVDRTKVTYLNRTWESFEFESVLHKLINETNILNQEEKDQFFNKSKKDEHDRTHSEMKTVQMIASLGDIFTDNKQESNAWKKRMLQAGLESKGLTFPADWDELTEEEKEKRLDAVIKVK